MRSEKRISDLLSETKIADHSVANLIWRIFATILYCPFIGLVGRVFAREIRVQSQVESNQIPKKWYLIRSCLTFSIIRHLSRVKWSDPGKGVDPSPTPRCSSYWKRSLRVAYDYGHQLYLTYTVHRSIVCFFLSSTKDIIPADFSADTWMSAWY